MNYFNIITLGVLGALPTGPALLGLYKETAIRSALPKRMILSFLIADFIFLALACLVYQQGEWVERYRPFIYLCSSVFLFYSGITLIKKRTKTTHSSSSVGKVFFSVILNPSIFLFYFGILFLLSSKIQMGLLFSVTTISLLVFLKLMISFALDVQKHLTKIHLISGIGFSLLGIHFLTKLF